MVGESTQKRARNLRVLVGCSCLAALFAALGLPLPSALNREPIYGALENLAHGPLFAGVMVLGLYALGKPALRNYAIAVALAGGLAVLTEFAQGYFSRDPQWTDVRTDIAGAIVGLALWALRFDARAARSLWARWVLIGVTALGVICILLPAVRPIHTWLDRDRRFPVLFDVEFAQWPSMTESMAADNDVRITARDGALQVELLAGRLPGVVFTKFVADWRDYSVLVFDLENPGSAELPLEIHVRDWTSIEDNDPGDWSFVRATLRPRERAVLSYRLDEIESGPANRPLRLNEVYLIAIYRIAEGSDEFRLHSIALQ